MIIHAKSGLLIEPDDPAAYVAAVETLVRSPIRRQELAVAAVQSSAAFDWSECLRGVVDSYLALLVSPR
ncbi:D-inositol-3-phosphate glycosyltransferase [compost metagenome]